MAFEYVSDRFLNYDTCRYGRSRLIFRGPYRMPQALDIAVVGGTGVFGKLVPRPFPVLLESAIRRPVVNLGSLHAGVDAFLDDPVVDEVCRRARTCVIQLTGAHCLSNRYFRVHPRRNDRFIVARAPLRRLFPEVDFSACTFTRHMLMLLRRTCPDRFAVVVAELRNTWMLKMDALIAGIGVPVMTLWVADHAPLGAGIPPDPGTPDPLFVTRDMVEQIRTRAIAHVEVVRPFGTPAECAGMVLAGMDAAAARHLPGPATHEVVARTLAGVLNAQRQTARVRP